MRYSVAPVCYKCAVNVNPYTEYCRQSQSLVGAVARHVNDNFVSQVSDDVEYCLMASSQSCFSFCVCLGCFGTEAPSNVLQRRQGAAIAAALQLSILMLNTIADRL